MRTLAWVWVGKGLFNWAIILGAFPGLGDFAAMALPLQATIVTFACFDLLAAVGLWLAAPWGGAIWLLCAVVEAVSPFLGPGAAAIGYFGALLNVAPHGRLLSSELAGGARARLIGRRRSGHSPADASIQTVFDALARPGASPWRATASASST